MTTSDSHERTCTCNIHAQATAVLAVMTQALVVFTQQPLHWPTWHTQIRDPQHAQQTVTLVACWQDVPGAFS